MTVAYGVSVVVPYVCGVYTCECGRRSVKHGQHAGFLPRGWRERPDGRHLCQACSDTRSRPTT